ncbi:hypothetical protein AYO40_01560 [Planctomycetaceae bacterium SCGC AG-212-D15]|nr:hypothetical protein AYO40_01560 [Planctomycetaceae bacterium SCGC AG-212-D15]
MVLLRSMPAVQASVGAHRTAGRRPRGGTAAVEFAVCLPWIMLIVFGLWEIGRMVEVNQTMWGACREGARQASQGTLTLNQVTTNVMVYLINAEPNAFSIPTGTTVTMNETPGNPAVVVASTPQLTNLLTLTYQNFGSSTNPSPPTQADPTNASQLDKFGFTISFPFQNIAWTSTSYWVGNPTMTATVYWYSLIDTPIVVNPVLPAQ